MSPRFLLPLLMCLACATSQLHALSAKVLEVQSAERLIVSIYDIPVAVALAHISVPASQQAAAVAKIKELAMDQRASVLYKDSYGTSDQGLGRVHLRIGSKLLNQALIEAGLAKYVKAGEGSHDRLFSRAETKAKAGKLGLWGAEQIAKADTGSKANTKVSTSKRTSTASSRRSSGKDPSRYPFCAELGNRYYYPNGDPAVAKVKPNRLIYYRSEADARKAGKKPAPQRRQAPTSIDVASADAAFAKGEKLYAEAVNLPPVDRRNTLYDQAFKHLTEAMQIYNQLVLKNPNDRKLSEKLRRTSQLRYGAMKQRTAF